MVNVKSKTTTRPASKNKSDTTRKAVSPESDQAVRETVHAEKEPVTKPRPAKKAKPGAEKEVILSGMQPTGSLHIGNLEGALRNWIELQDQYTMYCCIVDWHALTAVWEHPEVLRDNIFMMAVDYLASGLDPEKCAIFIQSEVKEHAELHLLFSMLISVPTLMRLPTYQEKAEHLDSYGFLGYPVLQAADICVYNAHKVPVGKDQAKHVWLANDLAKRFNHYYGPTLNEPEGLYREIPLILGSDNRKMSKSYDNHIPLDFTEEETAKRLRTFYTDSQKIRLGDPGRPEQCPIYLLHRIYTPGAEESVAAPCRSGALGCVECKKRLADNLNAALRPIRARRQELLRRPGDVWDVLADGARRARERAAEVMEKIHTAMKLNYRKQG
ncbi:MAG TPA: tryptophan--tRNA ligase [candidate division Zixibacteria bacterium]|nr:tryptophan--tRNA ligase [candidate division Zixibacteria bacterium]MDD4917894.1 tryptophan--tRNA ligase [candidate division Zixibacteria bacterium]MDM7973494.1 tryptophan--tRNA ligase [candidate division Zixibacteria bacterium]HOD66222.1 tryptophan--tRNA ligase [candidate division Zixibacteria bacterium]HPI32634.1 tryptophan--tRNA ligase [candidate division Zixibacteria bacterium]